MSGKIKICHVINAFENGGAEAVILNYISHMNRSRFEFHVISHGVVSQVCEKKFHDLGFIVHLIPSKKHPLKHVGEMYKICKKEQFDILHIATTEWAFIAGFVGMAAGCKHRINHSHMAECPQGFLSKITFHVKVWLSKISTNEHWACGIDAAKALFGSGNVKNNEVQIFNNAVEFEKYGFDLDIRSALRKKFGFSKDTLVIGNVGRFSPQKNHEYLIDIFAKTCAITADSRLILVGEGPLKERVEEKVAEKKLENKVLFLGARNDVNCLYQMMDLLLMPSFMEGLPLVGIEAQMSGLKVLFSDVVTSEVNFTGNCEYESLNSPAEIWAQHAVGMRNAQRKTYYDERYDITKQAKYMEKCYLTLAEQ